MISRSQVKLRCLESRFGGVGEGVCVVSGAGYVRP